ncbi:aminoglycoside phosphotransferase family protein [Microlunatus speluncae]|uniref:aminoglycoside phosphotransferase family protein n=1 Tax=Microlunatus speluncae TaxID=2594267 RepID=UPI0012664321|nr:aminoglycoside phosphotransferase family protein [Microlunatus speluncae]
MNPTVARDEVPDLGPVPTRIPVDERLVRELIMTQFPQWSELPIRRVAEEGWDNRTFHLGPELMVRVPSAYEYGLAVEKEQRWLPVLAPQLPLPIPEPVALGEPGAGYPYHWSVYRWLPGDPVSRDAITDLTGFATALADFLLALRAIDATDAPGPGLHNWFRGGTLLTFAAQLEENLITLAGLINTEVVTEIWRLALESPWDGVPLWFHGDVASGNLLLRDGSLGAVIDFGTCGAADPACDLTIAWTLLTGESRAAFRDRLAVDEASWARGRGWALWKALSGYAGAVRDDQAEPIESRSVLEEIVADHLAR